MLPLNLLFAVTYGLLGSVPAGSLVPNGRAAHHRQRMPPRRRMLRGNLHGVKRRGVFGAAPADCPGARTDKVRAERGHARAGDRKSRCAGSQGRSRAGKPHGRIPADKRESGGIGRRARLRIWWGNPWGFESPLSQRAERASRRGGARSCHLRVTRLFGVAGTRCTYCGTSNKSGVHPSSTTTGCHNVSSPGSGRARWLTGRGVLGKLPACSLSSSTYKKRRSTRERRRSCLKNLVAAPFCCWCTEGGCGIIRMMRGRLFPGGDPTNAAPSLVCIRRVADGRWRVCFGP